MLGFETTPLPTPTPTVDPALVTPGPIGFAIMAIVVAVSVLLIWDMQRRVRRARYKEQVNAKLDAEQAAERAAAEADVAPKTSGDEPVE